MISKWIGCITAALLLLACGMPPQTRPEFRDAILKGVPGARKEQLIIARPFQQVVSHLRAKADACLNLEVENTYHKGIYTEKIRYVYQTKVATLSETHAELTMQMTRFPRGPGAKEPPGGYFWILADIERETPNRTKVNLYYTAQASEKALEAIKNWANGKQDPCPKGW